MSVSPVFAVGRIGSVALRNRIVKSATNEGMTVDGLPSQALLRFHRSIAAGGAAMTTVAYCAVSAEGRTFDPQLWMRPEAVPPLRRLVDAVHAQGAAASLQLAHCGGFTKSAALRRAGGRALGPSRTLNVYGVTKGLPLVHPMSIADMARTAGDFAGAAHLAVEAGFDAVELHYGHGYLLSQFLSPHRNGRRDAFGGSLENRLRFPLDVLRAVRAAVGPELPLIAKMNVSDGVRGGLEVDEAVEVARALAGEGISAVQTSGGLVSHSAMFLLRGEVPLREMAEVEDSALQRLTLRIAGPLFVRPVPFEPLFFLDAARRIADAVSIPVILVGGARHLAELEQARAAGIDFVALGRALVHDPDLPRRYAAGEASTSGCEPCNLCITEMDRPGGVVCARQPSQVARRAAEVAEGAHRRVC